MFLFVSFICYASLIHAAPLETVSVDLTYAIDETIPGHPAHNKFQTRIVVNGSVGENQWRHYEEITSPTHMGTHVDAPSHFVRGGITVDQIPVSKFTAPAAVIRIASKAAKDPDALVTVEDLLKWEKSTGKRLDGTIVLVDSGWGTKWHDPEEFLGNAENDVTRLHYPGISGEAAQWLVDNRVVNGVGVDTVSIDNGITKEYPAHNIILGKGLFAVENVANLEKIPIYGATVHVMPIKIGRASGAPTRVVATFPKILYHEGDREYCSEI